MDAIQMDTMDWLEQLRRSGEKDKPSANQEARPISIQGEQSREAGATVSSPIEEE